MEKMAMAKRGTRVASGKAFSKETSPNRIGLSVSAEMNTQIDLAVLKENYGMKGKSRWVSEAVIGFMDDPGWLDHLEADRIAEKNKPITVVLSEEAYQAVVEGVRRLRLEYPMARNPHSQIIRGAMLWRLAGLDSRPLRKLLAASKALSSEDR